MTARREFMDPLVVLLEREAKTCRGCVHWEPASLDARAHCGNHLVKQLVQNQRCEEYEEPGE